MNSLKLLLIAFALAVAMAVTAGCGGENGGDESAARSKDETRTSEPLAEGGDAPGAHDRGGGADAVVATCAAHGADASLCYFCDASLRDPSRLWCREHNCYEDRCFICHPELFESTDDAATDAPSDVMVASSQPSGTKAGGLYCTEHDLHEIECGICHPELADRLEPGAALKVRLPSVESAAKAGVTTSFPTRESAGRTVSAVGEVGYNLNHLARITPLADGVVRALHTDLGDAVENGAPLVTVASPAISSAKADFLTAVAEETAARRTFERERELVEKNVSPESDLIDARARLSSVAAGRAAAEQRLRDLGFTSAEIDAIARGDSPGSTVTLRAPFAGTIVARDAVAGDVVSVGTELLRLADLGELWVTIAVPERDVAGIEPGQTVEIRSQTAGLEATATVTWVASHLNPSTRMAEVRATIENPARGWKAGMFVDARIQAGAQRDGLAVPAGAVHHFGGQPFVFVHAGDGLYEVRRIDLAGRADDRAFVTAGLSGDDRVVTSQSFLVKSEFQKSRLGAGCVD